MVPVHIVAEFARDIVLHEKGKKREEHAVAFCWVPHSFFRLMVNGRQKQKEKQNHLALCFGVLAGRYLGYT